MTEFLNLPCRNQEGQVNMCLINVSEVDFIFPIDEERTGMGLAEQSIVVEMPIDIIRRHLNVVTPMRQSNA